ncbi:MAG: FG-GAP repeat protein [Dehalococcoidia bacterium]|nr:MAG: FG-GAP repeat protein [Dehalococcoidia bacterium]
MKTLRMFLLALVALAVSVAWSGHAQTLSLTLDSPNPQEYANFGHSVAAGDVNGDGKADIAVGAVTENVSGNSWQGRVYVFSGDDGSLLFTLDTPNPQEYANFGQSVAAGDVNGDGKADIAVGAADEDASAILDAGRAYVFSGDDGSLLLTLDTPNPQEEGYFGRSVAIGEVNGDGKADIAVGAFREDVGVNTDVGRAYVFSGDYGSLLLTLDSPNPVADAWLGGSMAMGDVNDDGKADIAVGAHGEEVSGTSGQGRAYVFSGEDGSLLLTLDTPNPQETAYFGESVAVGEVNGDGKADIAVGAYYEHVAAIADAGRAYVFSGDDGSLLFTLDTPNPQDGANFGRSVAVGDVDGDGKADIAVGADDEDVGGNTDAGQAHVYSGDDGSLLFSVDTPNPQPYGELGRAVAIGDANGDGKADIAVGAPIEDVGDMERQGRAYVFTVALAITVDVDIKPGGDPNSINLKCHGVIPVAILTTEDFDASMVDAESVLFEGATAKHWALEDVDKDGDEDLILHFRCQEVSIERDATEACLEGETYDGRDIEGCDSVRLVPPDHASDCDDDGFTDAIEVAIGTDPSDACPDDAGDDAWPLDISMDKTITVAGDALNFRDRIGATPGEPEWWQRLDLNADGMITAAGDAIMYRGMIGESCT